MNPSPTVIDEITKAIMNPFMFPCVGINVGLSSMLNARLIASQAFISSRISVVLNFIFIYFCGFLWFF